jgi:hypothetical protein
MSSLSAPDVQDDRLTGRKEIAARLAELTDAFGDAPLEGSASGAVNLDPVFECQVADQLELRGYTFEAELRYRRLHRHPAVANRLALLLDAKGFRRESWQWYLRAARSKDMNSLVRLATICWSRGERGWAMRLTKHAVAQLEPDAYNELVTSIEDLVRQRTAALKPDNHMSVRFALNPNTSADAVYALGSVLLVLASRPDLARLAYCSALARGHSLAALSLLDLTRAPMIKGPSNWYLSNMLQDGFNGDLEKYSLVAGQCNNFDRSLLLLKNDVQNETLEGLIQEIRAPTDHRQDALERILFTTRLITILRGYGQLGHYTRAFRYIDMAADIVCRKVYHRLVTGKVAGAASLINMIREWSVQELNNYRQSKQQCPHSRCKKKNGAEEPRGKTAISGTLRRLRREYFDLPPQHREVLLLQLAGLYSDEVANVLDHRKIDTDQMFADAVTRLREAQQGEQISTGKLLGMEVDSCFPENVREHITSLPAWRDAGATRQPRLSLNPRKQLNLQRARRLLALATRRPRA